MSVLIPQQSGRAATLEARVPGPQSTAQYVAWTLLGWLGAAFFVMSLIDISLGWYPARFGTPEWEFGSIAATFVGLSIPCLSLFLALCSAIALERTTLAKVIGGVMVVFALLLPALGILYLTNVPFALRATATNDVAHFGMKKAIIKTLMLFIGYELLFILGAYRAFRGRFAV